MSAYAEPFSDEVIFSKRHTRVIKTIARSIFPSAADPFGNYRFGERGGMTRSRACADGETELSRDAGFAGIALIFVDLFHLARSSGSRIRVTICRHRI